MPEIIRCPGCEKKLKVPTKYLERVFNCPRCGQTIQPGLTGGIDLPAEGEEVVASATPPDGPEFSAAAVDDGAFTRGNHQWFVHAGDRLLGPYQWKQLHNMARRGVIGDSTPIAFSREGPWHPAVDIPGLFVEHPGVPTFSDRDASAWLSSAKPASVQFWQQWLPDAKQSDAAVFRVAIALLVVAGLAICYTFVKSIALVLEDHGLIRSWATLLWWLYLLATFGLMMAFFLMNPRFRKFDRHQLILSTAFAIPIGLGILAADASLEVKRFDVPEILWAMQVLKDVLLYTNLFLVTMSLLGLALTGTFGLEGYRTLAAIAIGFSVLYCLLVLLRITTRFTPGQIAAMLCWAGCLAANYFVFNQISRAAKRQR